MNDLELTRVRSVFRSFPRVEKAVAFGTRAMGDHDPDTVIEIALYGDLTLPGLLRIEDKINALSLPYGFELSIHHFISTEIILKNIEAYGLLVYDKGEAPLHAL